MRRPAFIVLWLVVFVGSILLFLNFNQDRKLVDWLSFAFIVLAQLVLLLSPFLARLWPTLSNYKKMTKSLVWIYVVISILIGLLFMNTTRESIQLLLIMQFLLIVAMGILFLVLSSLNRHPKERFMREEIERQETMEELISILGKIEEGEREEWIALSLRNLSGHLRLTEPEKASDVDESLRQSVGKLEHLIFLETRSAESIGAALQTVEDLIHQRRRSLQGLKSHR